MDEDNSDKVTPMSNPLLDPVERMLLQSGLTRRDALRLSAAGLVLAVPGVAMAQQPAAPFNARKFKPGTVKPVKPTGEPIKVDMDKVRASLRNKGNFKFEGEELYYAIEVSGSDAARASVRVGKRQKARGTTYVPLAAQAVSHGFFAKSYPIDNKADTFINFKTLQPIKSDKFIKESGEERIYKVRYEPGNFSARVERTAKAEKKKAESRKFVRAVPETIHDAFSWLFELRMEPLKKGDVYYYFVYDGWKLSKLKVKVTGKGKATTPLGKFSTMKVDIEREVLNSRWPKGSKNKTEPKLTRRQKPYYFSTIHLTDDELRTPVRIYVTSSKADSELELVKYVAP